MPEKTPTDLTLERLARLGASIDALTTSVSLLASGLNRRMDDMQRRLDSMDGRLTSMEGVLREVGSEGILNHNATLAARQVADQAHRRIDEIEGKA